MKVAFITTVFNEEETITKLLKSLLGQSTLPNEIIIVDGGSTDTTVEEIKKHEVSFKRKKIRFDVYIKKGNRSVGRNEAIRRAKSDIIVCSDSGNILDRNWIKNITKPFVNNSTDVVAGYYKGKAETIFQKAVIPYALVMEDKVDPIHFLPATRSVAFRRRIWKQVGGFREEYSHNEDYVFATELKASRAKIIFVKDAIVYWLPRKKLKQAFTMMWRFAFGDAEAGIIRTKVLLVFARYLVGLYFLLLCALYKSLPGILVSLLGLLFYLIWSIQKNYKYVKDKRSFYLLPTLQFTADAAVISGSIAGFLRRISTYPFIRIFTHHKFLLGVLLVYATILLLTLQWGIPGENRLYPYHMDEWHQLQAVGNTFRFGTPNTEGSANGTMFHFLLSGLYLIPFTAFQIVDPFSLQLENWFMREQIFEVLRLETILFGILTIIILYKTAELINASKKLIIVLFTFSPIWMTLSGYFKYDIALIFWIILSVYFFLRYAKVPNDRNLVLAAIPVSIAIAVKISAMPLLIIYNIAYFLFSRSRKKQFTNLLLGNFVLVVSILLFGMPDTLFGKGNILEYLHQNIVSSPQFFLETHLGSNAYNYLFTRHFPIIFSYGLVLLFIGSFIYGTSVLVREGFINIYRYKVTLFLAISLLIFILSLLTIGITAAGNRSLVLLPFIVLLVGIAWNRISKVSTIKPSLLFILICVFITEVSMSFAFLHIKFSESPQQKASAWIKNTIPPNSVIGIENIPIYQNLPDIIERDYYLTQNNNSYKSQYKYTVVGSKAEKLPSIIIITNEDLFPKVLKGTDKETLMDRLLKEGYKRQIVFYPDIKFYSLFGNDVDYYHSGLIAIPWTTSVYTKK